MLKVGIIGCGYMGTMHANCYKALGATIAAVADLRPEKARAVAAGTNAKIYCDGDELIAAGGLDIIDICLPTYLHAEYALKAMKTVGYLFVEKPLALTAEEGDRLLAAAKESGCNVQVGQVIRFWDEYVELRKIISSGKYGRVVNANFRRLSPRPDWGWRDWLTDVKLSGGAAQDLHIHDIDFVLALFGKPQSFSTVKNAIGEKNSYINTLMRYKDFVVGVEGTWDLPASHPFQATFRVVLEEAVIENDGGKFLLYTKDGVRPIEIKKDNDVGGVDAGGNISDLSGYYNELKSFTESCQLKRPVQDATLADALESLKFLLEEISD